MPKRKIAYLLEDTSLCGGVKVVFEHARLLSEKGFFITIVSPGEQPTWFDLGKVEFLSIKKEFSYISDFLSSFDLVIATYYRHVLDLYSASINLAHFSQGYEAEYPFWKQQKNDIERAYKLPVPKITISRRVATVVKERFFQSSYYIPQGINIGLFTPRGAPSGIRKVAVVGTWENKIKGIRDAVSGFSMAKKKIKDLSLIRVSTLPLSDEERAIYTPDEYYTSVLPENMPHIYRQCDLSIVPSLEGEGFGLPALEAMACGLPVILTRIHSFLSLDSAKDYAYFVSSAADVEIADAIIRLSLNRELTGTLSERARQVAEKYSLEKTIECLIPVFNILIGLRSTKHKEDIDFIYIERFQKETAREERLLAKLSKETFGGNGAFKNIISENPLNITVSELLNYSSAPLIAISLDDTIYFSKNWAMPLAEALENGFDLASPVCTDFFEVDMPYYTPLTFNDVAEHMSQKHKGHYINSTQIPPLAFLLKRSSLTLLPPETYLSELFQKLKSAIVPSSLVHRFGDFYTSNRHDILSYVPHGIKKILDVGCARGLLGEMIKRERGCEVYGIEFNRDMAEKASGRLDAVFCTDIEDASLPFHEDTDVVIFADILEHLIDPWSVLKNTHKWLKPDGMVIASIPNTAHYSVVLDLLRGRWDYIPLGLLCITHLRFFTRATIEEMFIKSGYSILTIKNQEYPVEIKKRITEKLNLFIKEENLDEEIFYPGYYVVAQKSNTSEAFAKV